jgi:hypothetical protein
MRQFLAQKNKKTESSSTDMFGSNRRPPMPRFAATYLSFFAAKSVCIGVHPWLKSGSVAAPLLQVFRVFRGNK